MKAESRKGVRSQGMEEWKERGAILTRGTSFTYSFTLVTYRRRAVGAHAPCRHPYVG